MHIGTNSVTAVYYIIHYPILDLNNHVSPSNITNANITVLHLFILLEIFEIILYYLKIIERQSNK